MSITYSVPPNDRVTYKIRLEDERFVVVDKPARVVTQPGLGHENDSLLSGLFARYGAKLQKMGKARDFGLLHRLDRATSGLLVVALDGEAYDRLRLAFEERRIRKFYWAIVMGRPRRDEGLIKKPILEASGADGKLAKVARITGAGKPALTAYRVLGSSKGASLLECRAVTGRLHQVRVHLAAVSCPILGDDLYGNSASAGAAPRLALHAHRLGFDHPFDGPPVDVRSVFPKELRGTLKRFGLPRPDQPAPESAAEGGAGSVQRRDEIDDDAVGDDDA